MEAALEKVTRDFKYITEHKELSLCERFYCQHGLGQSQWGGRWSTPVFLGCYSGLWARIVQCAALKDAAGQRLDLLKTEVKMDSGCGPLKTHLYISWEMSLPNGEGSLGNLDTLSESETVSE